MYVAKAQARRRWPDGPARAGGDCTVKLAYAAKQLFRFYPIGHHDRGSAGEIILSALRRCERHLSNPGYLIADAVKRCGRLVQSPGFSRQPLQIFRLFRAFTSMKEETAGVYSSCSSP